jgi:hypothetical protein
MFLNRNDLDWQLPLIDVDPETPVLPPRMNDADRVALLRSNRSKGASELGRLLGQTSHYGPTYVLLISTFQKAFPEIPKEPLTLAVIGWRGVGGKQTDAEFDEALSPWLPRTPLV